MIPAVALVLAGLAVGVWVGRDVLQGLDGHPARWVPVAVLGGLPVVACSVVAVIMAAG